MRTLTAADGVAVYFKAILADLVVQLIGSIIISIAGQNLSGDGLMTLNLVLMAFIQITFFFGRVLFGAEEKAEHRLPRRKRKVVHSFNGVFIERSVYRVLYHARRMVRAVIV